MASEMENEYHLADGRLSKNANLEEANNMMNSMEHRSNGSVFNENSESEEGMKCQELAGSLPNDIFVYRQDVVSCRKYEGLVGVVMEVAGDADSEGSITDDSDSKDDGERISGNDGGGGGGGDGGDENCNADGGDIYDSLPDGQVRVIWTDGSETAENINDVTVVDRSFLHGDIVASASDPTGQLGLVVDVSITVDLLAANGDVIKYVSSKDLKRTREPLVGDYVVLGSWLGRVDDVLDNVTVLFDDGSVCKVLKADPLRLKPLSRPVADDASCPYYPGQRVRGVSSSVFKSSRWLSGLWKANRLEGTVIKVQAVSVVVYWMASAYLGIGTNSTTAPSEEQDPKNLTLLSCFSYANWQVGDWCHLPSPSLPSSFADEASKTSTEPIEGSRSGTKHSEEFLVGQHADSHINSCSEGSDQALDVLGLILGEHQASEIPGPEVAVQDEIVKSSHVIMSGDLDLNFYSGHKRDGCNEISTKSKKLEGNFQSQSHDSLPLDEASKVGEKNGTESNNFLPECGSCSSSLSVSKELSHESWPAYRKKLRKVFFKRDKKPRRRDETFERALFIVNTVTEVDVAWQDGARGYGLDSKSLIPINTPSDNEFFPEQYVVEKASNEDDDSSGTDRVGIVRSVNSKERTVRMRWFKPVSGPEDPREFACDEVVSAYELDEHPDYDYCYGDVVVRLSPVSVSADTADYGSPVKQPEQHANEGNESRKHSDDVDADLVTKEEACADFTSLSWVGNITGLQDGDIEVTWADGMVSKVGPQAVFVVGREDDGDSFDGGSVVSDDGASWETVDENEMDTLEDAEKEAGSPTDNIVEKEEQTEILPEDNNAGTNGPLSMPVAALGFVTRLATGLFSRGRKQLDILDTDHAVVNETESVSVEVSNMEVANDELSYEESDALDNLRAQITREIAERHSYVAVTEDAEVIVGDNLDTSISLETNAGSAGADSRDDPCSFKHFDTAENPLDHYFLGSGQNFAERKWVKKVQQEWSILEKNLPDAISVRVFEDRMDLLRAVIVGACGTPYQDGLFFFDFHLPPEYPQVPPSAYYHSGGLRVNPNLYVDGKVCLSLLNTWTGRGNEVWDPSSSSILQVLVSLQGLVLNSKPYFNEAGYEKQVGTVEGEKNALPYNENTYLLNLKSMLYHLRRPPMHFEDFVKDHFRRRGHYILKACDAYMEGFMIGSLTKDACTTVKSREHPCSVGFKLMLDKILPRLITALSEAGVDCHQFEHLLNCEIILSPCLF